MDIASCKKILDLGLSTGSGNYYINPDASTPIQVYCEMSVDSGGWTLYNTNVESSSLSGTSITKNYLYYYNNRYFRSPNTTIKASWSSYQSLTGTYTYYDGTSTSTHTCSTDN